MEMIILHAFNALSVSSILLLAAIGLALTFGLMNVINLAHGELMMVGAYTTYVIQNLFEAWFGVAGLDYYFLVAIPAAFLVAGVVGVLVERSIIQFLYERPLDTLLATWGISLALQQIFRDVFGSPMVEASAPSWLDGGLQVTAGLSLSYSRMFIIGLVLAVLVGLYVFLYYSRQGRRMRAVLQDRRMASAMGVPTQWVDALAFGLGSGLAGVAGSALVLLGPIGPTTGLNYIVDAFMVVVLGGVGRLLGTAAGAVTFGFGGTFLEIITSPSMGKALMFALVIAFLQWRPQGLLTLDTRE